VMREVRRASPSRRPVSTVGGVWVWVWGVLEGERIVVGVDVDVDVDAIGVSVDPRRFHTERKNSNIPSTIPASPAVCPVVLAPFHDDSR